MEKLEVRIKKLEGYKGSLPEYQSKFASGLDVRAQLDKPILIERGERVLIPTKLSVDIPEGFEIQVRPRSGLALKQGITVLNSPGTIDSDYRGPIGVILFNAGNQTVKIEDQDRIAQLVLCPIVQMALVNVEDLVESQRGVGGFGSTGV